ncbi:prepilin peptidase [Candidatus Saccharibacteria bacterium]|nr:prepilin peptidase [Candidatus Saccharibacteria bacterium]
MNEVVFLAILFVFGAVFGSFACCQAWRLRLKEEGKKSPGKRSVCMSCGRKLKFSENLPILSWVFLKGRCKECRAKIGKAEILSEIGLATVFILIGMYFYDSVFVSVGGSFPLVAILKMVLVLFAVVAMWVVVVYDAKWGRMPNMGLLFANIFAAAYLIVTIIFEGVAPLSLIGAIGFLPGLYYVLYIFSKEKLVGGGDWLLALAVAMILPNWFLALAVLFVANFLASIFSVPIMLKEGKKAQVPFGPFLFTGFLIVFMLQEILLKIGLS